MIYVVTMYRWGSRGNHSYVLGLYRSLKEAIAAGEIETENRAEKYEYGAVGFNDDCEEFERHSYVDINEGQVEEYCARNKLKDLERWLNTFEYENDLITVHNVKERIKI